MLELFQGIYSVIKGFIIFSIGVYCHTSYEEKYGKSPLQIGPFLLQSIVLFGCLLLDYLGYKGYSSHKSVYICEALGVLISYAIGLWMCWKHEKAQPYGQGDVLLAMGAQALLPIGLAGVLFVAIVIISTVFGALSNFVSLKSIFVILIMILFFAKFR